MNSHVKLHKRKLRVFDGEMKRKRKKHKCDGEKYGRCFTIRLIHGSHVHWFDFHVRRARHFHSMGRQSLCCAPISLHHSLFEQTST